MIIFKYLLALFLLLMVPVVAQSDVEGFKQLDIGIEDNRLPYGDLTNKSEAVGLLVDALHTVCEKIKAKCNFIGGDADRLLQSVQSYELDALLVIDSILLPNIDKLRLTNPICRIRPVFIQRQEYPDMDTFISNALIGVQENSLLHLYLLDEYIGDARLRTYSLLENGLFDFSFGRIDALFAGKAFFDIHESRIRRGAPVLTVNELSEATLEAGAMSVAVNVHDPELFNEFELAIQDFHGGNPPDCADLVSSKHELPILNTTDINR